MKHPCSVCNITFIGARSAQLYADHSWTHPELVAAVGLDPAIWCTS